MKGPSLMQRGINSMFYECIGTCNGLLTEQYGIARGVTFWYSLRYAKNNMLQNPLTNYKTFERLRNPSK